MQISISSPNFSLIPFEKILPKIALHFENWEIVAEGEHHFPKIKNKFKELMPSYNLKMRVHAPFSDLNIASVNELIRENSLKEICDCIKISNELGINVITLHPGHFSPLGVLCKKKVKEINRNSIIKICKFADEYGVEICFENTPKGSFLFCHEPKEILNAIKGTSARICFDVGHANISANIENFLRHWKKFGNVHLHDNFGDRDKHLQIGKGNINFKNVFEKLKEYNGNFTIESRGLKSGIESKKWLEKFIQEL